MKQFLIFLSGLIVGTLLTIFVLIILGNSLNSPINEPQVQYIDIKGKKGYVKLHTGMIKDSVLILVGKPDVVNLNSIGGMIFEDWGYKLKNKYVSDLDINFVDGKLQGVRQN
jgi:hypothetical protein